MAPSSIAGIKEEVFWSLRVVEVFSLRFETKIPLKQERKFRVKHGKPTY